MSPRRGVTRSASPTSAPPSSRRPPAHTARARRPGLGIVTRRRRRRASRGRGRMGGRARGVGGERLVEAEPRRRRRSSAASCPAVPISTTARVQPSSSRRCADRRRSRSSHRSPRRTPRACREDLARSGLDQRLGGRGPVAPRPRSGRRPPRPGRRSRRSGSVARRSALAEQVGDLRLADPGQSIGPDGDVGRRARAARGGGGPRRPTSGASRAAARAARRSPRRRAA